MAGLWLETDLLYWDVTVDLLRYFGGYTGFGMKVEASLAQARADVGECAMGMAKADQHFM